MEVLRQFLSLSFPNQFRIVLLAVLVPLFLHRLATHKKGLDVPEQLQSVAETIDVVSGHRTHLAQHVHHSATGPKAEASPTTTPATAGYMATVIRVPHSESNTNCTTHLTSGGLSLEGSDPRPLF